MKLITANVKLSAIGCVGKIDMKVTRSCFIATVKVVYSGEFELFPFVEEMKFLKSMPI